MHERNIKRDFVHVDPPVRRPILTPCIQNHVVDLDEIDVGVLLYTSCENHYNPVCGNGKINLDFVRVAPMKIGTP
jgi:hypothetical protein